MEGIDTKEKSNEYKNFELMDSFRIVIYSICGIFIFFLPINLKGSTNTIIYHLYFFIQSRYIELIKLYLFIMVSIGSVLPIIKHKEKEYDALSNIIKCIKPISILFILIIFSKIEFRAYNNSSLLFMRDFLFKSVIILSISSFFLPLITEYGLLEIFEAYFQKYTKKAFKLSGKCVLNVLVYLFVDIFSGMFMTSHLYKKGKFRQSEACIMISCFSFTSILNCYYLADDLNLKSVAFTIFMVINLSLVVNFLMCRIWPLKVKKKSYLCKSSYKECSFKKDKFKNAIRRHVSTKKNNKLIFYMFENFKESFNIIMTILPNLVIIIFVGEFLINNTGLIDTIGEITYPIIEMFNLPSKVQINEALCLGMFNGGRYIELINNDIKDISGLIIFIISIVQTISISTNMVYVDSTDIPIKKMELLVIGIEKILISLTIIYLFYYLIIGNL
ncbi:YjiH family protein [Paraclostridium bifermentans]|uniref:YjiH family protein n=1 Tax=Paraclostridium bifermentans TaxID=1490 RepID=UPI003D2C9901